MSPIKRNKRVVKLKPVHMIVKKLRLQTLYSLHIPEALSCILSREPVTSVEIIVIPVPRNGDDNVVEKLVIPRSLKKKKKLIDWLLRHCDSFMCNTLSQRKPYPEYYDTERCMLIQTSERNYIVYVRDILQVHKAVRELVATSKVEGNT